MTTPELFVSLNAISTLSMVSCPLRLTFWSITKADPAVPVRAILASFSTTKFPPMKYSDPEITGTVIVAGATSALFRTRNVAPAAARLTLVRLIFCVPWLSRINSLFGPKFNSPPVTSRSPAKRMLPATLPPLVIKSKFGAGSVSFAPDFSKRRSPLISIEPPLVITLDIPVPPSVSICKSPLTIIPCAVPDNCRVASPSPAVDTITVSASNRWPEMVNSAKTWSDLNSRSAMETNPALVMAAWPLFASINKSALLPALPIILNVFIFKVADCWWPSIFINCSTIRSPDIVNSRL